MASPISGNPKKIDLGFTTDKVEVKGLFKSRLKDQDGLLDLRVHNSVGSFFANKFGSGTIDMTINGKTYHVNYESFRSKCRDLGEGEETLAKGVEVLKHMLHVTPPTEIKKFEEEIENKFQGNANEKKMLKEFSTKEEKSTLSKIQFFNRFLEHLNSLKKTNKITLEQAQQAERIFADAFNYYPKKVEEMESDSGLIINPDDDEIVYDTGKDLYGDEENFWKEQLNKNKNQMMVFLTELNGTENTYLDESFFHRDYPNNEPECNAIYDCLKAAMKQHSEKEVLQTLKTNLSEGVTKGLISQENATITLDNMKVNIK